MRVDLHQHLWPEELLEALRGRAAPPRLDGWVLHLPGEPPYRACPADHDPARRTQLATEDGVDLVGLSLSPALGVELLPADPAQALLRAWHEGAQRLGPPFGFWVSAAISPGRPMSQIVEQVRDDLARPGALGLQLPAAALSTPAGVARLGPVLAEATRADRPVLVHPGPVPAGVAAGQTRELPPWWPAVVDYVGQLHAAWHAWQVAGLLDHPGVRIAFVALAGLAPLHHERLRARGGRPSSPTPSEASPTPVFYETSSYGPAALAGITAVVGGDVLVNGSDRPNAVPGGLPPSLQAPNVMSTNPLRLLKGDR